MKGRRIAYTDEELAWIEARQDWPRRDLHAAFVEAFGRGGVTFENFKALCTRRGFRTGRDGRFVRGQTSHNKGRKGWCAPGSEKGWFRKGGLPQTYRGPGHESIDPKDGYVWMIVAATNPHTGAATRRVLKHKWLWEELNGPVPEGHCLKCLDGDRTNTDPSNWVAIPRAMLPRLAGRWNASYDQAEQEVRPVLLAAAQLEYRAREIRKEKRGEHARKTRGMPALRRGVRRVAL